MSADPRKGWLRGERPDQPVTRRLVCFPHAGGSARAFGQWQEQAPAGLEVLAVQYPGRHDRMREPAIEDMETLAAAVAAAVEPACGLPLSFFGHSMGAVVAYEVARMLERNAGVVLERLFVSGHTTGARTPVENNHGLPDEDLIAAIRRLGGTDAQVFEFPKLWPVILAPLRSDLHLLDQYRLSALTPLRCSITAFGGAADHTCHVPDLTAWEEATAAEFDFELFPGGHHYLFADGAVLSAVADRLQLADRFST